MKPEKAIDYSAFNLLKDGIQIISPSWTYVFVNDILVLQSKKTREELLGSTMQAMYPGIENTLMFSILQECMKSQIDHKLVNEFNFPDGSVGYFELRMQRIEEGVLIISSDVTKETYENRKLEEIKQRYKYLTTATSKTVWDWNIDSDTIQFDESFNKSFDLAEGIQTMEGVQWRALIHPQDQLNFNEVIERSAKANNTRYEMEYRIRKKDNSYAYVQDRGIMILDEQGKLMRIIGAIEDISIDNMNKMQQSVINNIAASFNNTTSLTKSLELVLDAILELNMDFKLGEIWLVDPKKTKINLTAKKVNLKNGHSFYANTKNHSHVKFGEGIPGKVWEDKSTFWLEDIYSSEVFLRRNEANLIGLLSVGGIPLINKDQVIGVLLLGSDVHIAKSESKTNFLNEITKHIGIEIDRKQLENELEHIFNYSPDILCLLDSEGNLLKFNSRTKEIFGYSEVELQNLPFSSLIDTQDRAKFNQLIKKGNKNKNLDNIIDLCCAKKNGETLWLNIQVNFNRDNDYINIVAYDFTDEKKLQHLLNSANRFARIGYWTIDLNTKALVLSDIAASILELHESEGVTIDDGFEFFALTKIDDGVRAYLKETIEKGLKWDIELPFNTKENKQLWIRMTGEPIIKSGECVEITGSLQDITTIKEIEIQLKNSEQRYSQLFHLSPIPMWVYDIETLQYVQVNKHAIEHYGYSEEEFLSMTLLDLRDKGDYQKVLDANQHFQIDASNPYMGRFNHRTKDGQKLLVDIYSSIIQIEHKNYGLVIGIDITDKVLFDNELTKAVIQAQENERQEIGRELHDNICQLIVVSQLSLNLLEEFIAEENKQWYTHSHSVLSKLFTEVRNLSHRFSPPVLNENNLQEVFESLIKMINVDNRFEISFEMDPKLLRYKLDSQLLQNVLRIAQEQFSNIIKHSNATNVNVHLFVEQDMFSMKITDNGVGFDIQKAHTGIGLNNITRRVDLFLGTMQIDTAINEGCSITIEIPLKK
jgi:PAS domain S-box-containing protein